MEGTIGEIRMFAGNFAPYSWAFCAGQTFSIRTYTALYAIIGTYYGGDGTNTFKLPDLQGRAIVGAGQGAGLSTYNIGNSVGVEGVAINTTQIPAHTHVLNYAQTGSASVAIKASADQSGEPSPSGNLLGAPAAVSETLYSNPIPPKQPVAMGQGTLKVNSVSGPQLTGLTVQPTGGSGPTLVHENRQPGLALNYVICINGIFPARD
ncbi:phage tail protein [uncultured Pedobacter sp.]|uniref:phage tail protein n=1 Tax=uncultured Pedobacter sp. TaxID=246139 RepID=UPI0025F8AC56|nr:tail fiber protein [uncultured Pedobacter sp.]